MDVTFREFLLDWIVQQDNTIELYNFIRDLGYRENVEFTKEVETQLINVLKQSCNTI